MGAGRGWGNKVKRVYFFLGLVNRHNMIGKFNTKCQSGQNKACVCAIKNMDLYTIIL